MSEKRYCDYQACGFSAPVADANFYVLARKDTKQHDFCSLPCLIAWASAEVRESDRFWEEARKSWRLLERPSDDAVRRSDELPIGSAREKER